MGRQKREKIIHNRKLKSCIMLAVLITGFLSIFTSSVLAEPNNKKNYKQPALRPIEFSSNRSKNNNTISPITIDFFQTTTNRPQQIIYNNIPKVSFSLPRLVNTSSAYRISLTKNTITTKSMSYFSLMSKYNLPKQQGQLSTFKLLQLPSVANTSLLAKPKPSLLYRTYISLNSFNINKLSRVSNITTVSKTRITPTPVPVSTVKVKSKKVAPLSSSRIESRLNKITPFNFKQTKRNTINLAKAVFSTIPSSPLKQNRPKAPIDNPEIPKETPLPVAPQSNNQTPIQPVQGSATSTPNVASNYLIHKGLDANNVPNLTRGNLPQFHIGFIQTAQTLHDIYGIGTSQHNRASPF